MGGTTSRCNRTPARVQREYHVLYFGRRVATMQYEQMDHGRRRRTERMRIDTEHMKIMATFIGG